MTREEAINTLANFKVYISGGGVTDKKANEALDLAIATLVNLPSAERPAGEWIKDEFGITVCSECKRPRRDSRVDHINFCNSCGARMINTK